MISKVSRFLLINHALISKIRLLDLVDRFCIIPLTSFLFLVYFKKDLIPYQVDSDEGINLMKAFLLQKNFNFMTEIWSDQPPIFTLFLKVFFDIFGTGINEARIFTLVISILGVVVIYKFFRQYLGFYLSTLAILFLFSNSTFAYYCTLIMIGYPAIILGLISIYLISLKQKSNLLPLLSGMFFALSIFTKLFTLLYFIPILFHLVFNDKSFKKTLLFFVSVLLVSSYIIMNFNLYEYKPLLMPHLIFMSKHNFDFLSRLGFIEEYVSRFFLVLSLISFIGLIVRFKNIYVVPLLLYVVSSLFIFLCFPIFRHHLIFFLIPSILLIGIFTSQVLNLFFNKTGSLLTQSVFCIVCIFLFNLSVPQYDFLKIDTTVEKKYNELIDSFVLNNYQEGDTLLSDLPIIPFLINADTDPRFAVFSRKRFDSGLLNFEDIGSQIIQSQPKFVFFGRFKPLKSNDFFNKYLNRNYKLILEDQKGIYFDSSIKVFKHI